MRVGRDVSLRPTDIGIELPGGIKVKFDGWEVLLAAAIVVLVLTVLITALQPWGWWVAGGLFVVWLLLVIFRPKS